MPIPGNDFIRNRALELITSTKVNSFEVSTITPLPFQPIIISWDVEPPMQVKLSLHGVEVPDVGSKEFTQFMKTEYHLTGRVGAERGNIRTVTVEPNLDSCTLFESGDGIETALSFYLTRVFRDVLSGNEEGFEDVFESFPELRNCYLPSNEEIAIKIENGFIRLKTKLKYRTDIIADPEMPITLDFRIIANKSLQEGGREAEQYGEVRASSFTVNLPWYLRIDIFNIQKQILVALLHDAFTDGMKILASLLADVIIGYFRFYAAVPNGLRFHHAICIKEADNDGLLNIHFCPNYISAFNPNISVLNANKKD